jgi:hypothetical protein
MIMLIASLWKNTARRLYPKRLYRWGTIGLKFHDDRTITEKCLDVVDTWLEDYIDKRRNQRANAYKYIFRSFFDHSSGKWMHSWNDIKQYEKENGKYYIPFNEIDTENKRRRANHEHDQSVKIQAGIKQVLVNVQKGHSYVHEQKRRLEAHKRGEY